MTKFATIGMVSASVLAIASVAVMAANPRAADRSVDIAPQPLAQSASHAQADQAANITAMPGQIVLRFEPAAHRIDRN